MTHETAQTREALVEVKVRPIIFSTPMVQALLSGRKTQTRRLASSPLRRVEVGDLLYVREAWGVGARPCPSQGCVDGFEYRADQEFLDEHDALPLYQIEQPEGFEMDDWSGGWKPSIHMPRWLSRLTLEVTRVRFDRLQAISRHDCYEEGLQRPTGPFLGSEVTANDKARNKFRALWNSLHDKPGERWEDDPGIVALTFTVHHANVDALSARKGADQ